MAALPSTQFPRVSPESSTNAALNELSRTSNDNLRTFPSSTLHAIPKRNIERPGSAGNRAPPQTPGTYYLKRNDVQGKHMVQYVYANLRDANDTSLPARVREKYKEIENERLRGYQPSTVATTVNYSKHPSGNSQNSATNKMLRPSSAVSDRSGVNNSPLTQGHLRTIKTCADSSKGPLPPKGNSKTPNAPAMQTRSSNAVVPPKRDGRSRSSGSPRRRRPFSIAADSTSDTDPIDNQRSIESLPQSPLRHARSRQLRRKQCLATKFKLALKNSKQTQTFVPALSGLSVDESSASDCTVISASHPKAQTNGPGRSLNDAGKPAAQTPITQPARHDFNNSEANDSGTLIEVSAFNHATDKEKPPIAPPSATKAVAGGLDITKKETETSEWKKVKTRLRSTPGSPSPPPITSKKRVSSADRVQSPSTEKTPSLSGVRPSSGNNVIERTSSDRRLKSPVSEKRLVTSSTQFEISKTRSTGVQVKMKKARSAQRRGRRDRRSPSQKSVASKLSLRSEGKHKFQSDKQKKTNKRKSAKSRDPSIRSLRSLHSFASDTSTSKHVKISPRVSRSNNRPASAVTGTDNHANKKSKRKKKKSKDSNNIARFLKQLSQDKEAIKVISRMAATNSKRYAK